MREYSGQLIGGPDDGNFVTASKDKIPVVSTNEMWLDGEGVDATVTIIIIRGSYIWQETSSLYMWTFETSTIYSKKVEAV